ncbi:MAG: gliding motility-associated C-terminal domain-containing protein, partial [Bacteroidales bacterium]|nr:gliding motility-associated C-terminal domain-containing protein [Bacteroidales bacterium]
IVYRDESDMRIIDGITGNNKSSFVCKAPTATDYPAIVDLDKDGQAEIIASSSTYDNDHDMHAKLVVFKSPANVRWAPARQVWSQHAYNVINVNNDLTIPADNFNPATTFTDPQGIVRRPFNNFLQQATTIDQYGRLFMSLANVSIDGQPQVTVEGDVMTLDLTVCNTGTIDFAAPLYISLYTHLGECVQTDEFPQSLQPGECATLQLAYDLNGLKNFNDPYPLDLVVNDNGQGTAQYGGLQAECDITDNHFRFDGRPCTITLPNVITPNGDGFNDVFTPRLEGDFLGLTMEIYDRWGKRVYRQESNDSLSWDAEGVSNGVFYCAIDYYCATSGRKRQHANTSVTVVR